MQLILNKFQKYYPEYDAKDKELTLYGSIPVSEFLELKLLIKIYNIEVKNIIVK